MNVERFVSILPAPVRVAGYFLSQRAIGSRIFSIWREFLGWERLSPAEVERSVEQRLEKLLRAALEQSSYYRGLGLSQRAGESAGQFLARFPTLNRETLRERFAEIVVDSLRSRVPSLETPPPRGYDWLIVKTGGTTGIPTTVLHDAPFRDWGRATRLYAQRLCGFPLGTRYFRLWGSEQDLLNEKERLDRRVLRAFQGEIPMNAFRAKERELAGHYQTLCRYPRVRHLMAYVDAAVSLCFFIRDKGLPAPKLDTLMACAGTVSDEWRRVLSETFQADVFDKYGSRECADMACECRRHNGLHVFSPHVYLEVVDNAGRPCPPGELGRLLVTPLTNASFPMIRYDIGDLAVTAEPGPCPCGLPFPRLQSLQGRPDDMLTTEDGTLLSSVFVRHFVGVSLNRQLIREWQLEQFGRGDFVFRYVPRQADGLEANLRKIEKSFLTALGSGARIRLEKVADIPPSPSGKTLWIINRLKGR